MPLTVHQRVDSATSELVTQAIRLLLEQKHLYQSAVIEISGVVAQAIPPVSGGQTEALRSQAKLRFAGRWATTTPHAPALRYVVVDSAAASEAPSQYSVRVPDIKAFCSACDRDEPFNCVSTTSVMQSIEQINGATITPGSPSVQVFALSYLCQSCKVMPEVFMIRRTGPKLTLCGRAPMAAVQLPAALPKKGAGKYVSDAIVAHQSGQTLAALFLLRVFVEQWLREFGAPDGAKADACLDWYAGLLPTEFSQRFPSLATIYSNLSGAIHSAQASTEIYQQALKDLVRHFDARRVYELPEHGSEVIAPA